MNKLPTEAEEKPARIHPAHGKNSHGLFIYLLLGRIQSTTGKRIARSLHMTRVLLVDDSEDVLYMLRLQLEWMGYMVEAATNASAAIDAATKLRPDVIVSDLRMPDMDGFQFICQVRSIGALTSVPAIALTGDSMDSDIRQAIASGFTAHLTKPVDASDLSKLIELLTARYLQRKAG
jgi:CheY-like chemotaxis protein